MNNKKIEWVLKYEIAYQKYWFGTKQNLSHEVRLCAEDLPDALRAAEMQLAMYQRKLNKYSVVRMRYLYPYEQPQKVERYRMHNDYMLPGEY